MHLELSSEAEGWGRGSRRGRVEVWLNLSDFAEMLMS